MQFSDVWDGHLHVEQIKTGAKVAIPLSLRCDAIGMTLEQIITQCRDHIVSPYLVHYTHNTAMARRGGMVKPNTISTSFKNFVSYRDCLGAKELRPAFTKSVRWPNAYNGNKKSILGIYLGIKASVKPIDTTMIEEKNGELLGREIRSFFIPFCRRVLQKIF